MLSTGIFVWFESCAVAKTTRIVFVPLPVVWLNCRSFEPSLTVTLSSAIAHAPGVPVVVEDVLVLVELVVLVEVEVLVEEEELEDEELVLVEVEVEVVVVVVEAATTVNVPSVVKVWTV